jgi:hypothetical protein
MMLLVRNDSMHLVDLFRTVDPSGLPRLSDLDERRQMLWVLRAAQERLDVTVMTPSEISVVLRDVYGVDLSRQRIDATLAKEKGTVAKRKIDGRRGYQLMASGSAELDTVTSAALFIDPAHGYRGLREAHILLAELGGDLRVCDPYADARTLDMLAECQRADSIRLLTQNIKKPDGFKQTVTVFAREHGMPLEVRKAPKGVLHDRYVIHDDGMLMFGTSLNGLGLKQSFVVALGEDMRSAALAAFEASWDTASPL